MRKKSIRVYSDREHPNFSAVIAACATYFKGVKKQRLKPAPRCKRKNPTG